MPAPTYRSYLAALSLAALGLAAAPVQATLTYALYDGGVPATNWTIPAGQTGAFKTFDLMGVITGTVDGQPIIAGGIVDAGLGANLTYVGTHQTDSGQVTAALAAVFFAPGASNGLQKAPVDGLISVGGTSDSSDYGWICARGATTGYYVPGTLVGSEVLVLMGTLTCSISALDSGDTLSLNLIVRDAVFFDTQIWYQSSSSTYIGSTVSAGAVGDVHDHLPVLAGPEILITHAAVPEPASALLLAAAAPVLLLPRRRRRAAL